MCNNFQLNLMLGALSNSTNSGFYVHQGHWTHDQGSMPSRVIEHMIEVLCPPGFEPAIKRNQLIQMIRALYPSTFKSGSLSWRYSVSTTRPQPDRQPFLTLKWSQKVFIFQLGTSACLVFPFASKKKAVWITYHLTTDLNLNLQPLQ